MIPGGRNIIGARLTIFDRFIFFVFFVSIGIKEVCPVWARISKDIGQTGRRRNLPAPEFDQTAPVDGLRFVDTETAQ